MCNVGIGVKKMTSVSGSCFVIAFATAYILVKCPKPTPFVGNKTTQLFLFSLIDWDNTWVDGGARRPIFSKPRRKQWYGKVRGKKSNFHGLRIDAVRCSPKRYVTEFFRRCISRFNRCVCLAARWREGVYSSSESDEENSVSASPMCAAMAHT